MRKFWTLVAAAALVVGCSEDLTSDLNVGPDGSLGTVGEGITLEVSVEDVTRVDIEKGKPAWEVGDCLTLVHDGKSYEYKAVTAGNTASFAAVDAENALETVDASKPVAAFYNVKSVNVEAMTAVFDVAAVQTVGEATNKVPFYTYSATTTVEENKLSLTMKPLASVVEFELTAASAWNADAVSLQSSYSVDTYAVASGVAVDATTGEISMAGAKTGDKVTVELGGAVDFATTRNVQMVVLAESFTVTKIIDKVETPVTVNPVYCDTAVLKLYKGGAENVRISMWDEAAAPSKKAHVYQKVANVLKNKKANGISTVAEFEAFAQSVNESTEAYPTGAEYSNEDGVIVLNSNLTLTAANWIAIGNTGKSIFQFGGIFDGNNKTIDGLKVSFNAEDHNILLGGETKTAQLNAGLFGVLANGGAIKNLTVDGKIIVAYGDATSWTYVGGVVAQVNGGSVTGCTSKVNIIANEYAAGKTRVGGIVARTYCSTDDVVIKDCTNEGVINLQYDASVASGSFSPQVGGIVAIVADGDEGYKTTVSYCDNKAAVSATNLPAPVIGGVIGTLNKVDEGLGEFVELDNSGAISAITPKGNTNVGGVIGDVAGDGVELITIKKCSNTGAVTLNDSNNTCGQPRIGGVIGYTSKGCIEIEECINSGTVTVAAGTGAQCYIGGVVGRTNAGSVDNGIKIKDCTNSGIVDVSAKKAGWSYAGGITSTTYGGGSTDNYRIVVDGCINSGRVSVTNAHATNAVTFRAGGILGTLNQYTKVSNCTHSGIVAMESQSVKYDYLGGIAGQLENTYALIDGCTNSGKVCCMQLTKTEPTTSETPIGKDAGNKLVYLGGLFGNVGGNKPEVTNCVSIGYLLASHDTNNDWENGTWKVSVNNANDTGVPNNLQYRGAIVGNTNTGLKVKDCQVGCYVGAVKGGDGTDRYDASVSHKLVNSENDTYHYMRWISATYNMPTMTNITYVDVQ
ncbi:MAG: hypothetical protein IJ942_01255 [Alistipes sp.]|nr:hypothetical protein [Alistipes sp.]